jgi:hypothetical protein
MLSGFTLAFARGDAYYGHYGASRTDPQGSAVIRGDTVQKIHVANLDPVWLTAISSDCQVAAYQYGTPAPNNAAIVSHGHTKTIEHAIVGSVNNAGNAVYFDNRTINQITFLKGNTATPIDIGALLGRAVEFGGSYYLNNNDVIAGTYREGDKSGAFILVNGHAHDLMTQQSIAQYNFAQVRVAGINDRNQVLLEGTPVGHDGSRLYRCDIDLSDAGRTFEPMANLVAKGVFRQ